MKELYEENSRKRIKILFTLDKDVSKIRQKSHAIKDHSNVDEYLEGNTEKFNVFKRTLSHHKSTSSMNSNLTIKQYQSMPFGILMAIGNYIWFSPLWVNIDVFNKGYFLIIRHDSELGKHLIDSFDKMFDNPTSIEERLFD